MPVLFCDDQTTDRPWRTFWRAACDAALRREIKAEKRAEVEARDRREAEEAKIPYYEWVEMV